MIIIFYQNYCLKDEFGRQKKVVRATLKENFKKRRKENDIKSLVNYHIN